MAEDDVAEKAEESKGGSRKKLILIIAIVAVILLGGGGAAAYFLLSGNAKPEAKAAEPAKKPDAIYTKIRTLEGRPMFVVTLKATDDSRHYMQIYVEAKSRDPAVAEALTKNMPKVVSLLNALFSSQQFTEMMTLEGKKALRAQATKMIQDYLKKRIGKPGIETILFTNLVMQ